MRVMSWNNLKNSGQLGADKTRACFYANVTFANYGVSFNDDAHDMSVFKLTSSAGHLEIRSSLDDAGASRTSYSAKVYDLHAFDCCSMEEPEPEEEIRFASYFSQSSFPFSTTAPSSGTSPFYRGSDITTDNDIFRDTPVAAVKRFRPRCVVGRRTELLDSTQPAFPDNWEDTRSMLQIEFSEQETLNLSDLDISLKGLQIVVDEGFLISLTEFFFTGVGCAI